MSVKIKSIRLQNFKRFTDLKIQNIPATAKLVVLLGPNGCGKSSLFDALHCEYLKVLGRNSSFPNYYQKTRGTTHQIEIDFHDSTLSEYSFCMRTAHRNEQSFDIHHASIKQIEEQVQPSPTEIRFNTMNQNDQATSRNFQRLSTKVHQEFLMRVKGTKSDSKNVRELKDEISKMFSEFQDIIGRLFTDLVFNILEIFPEDENSGLTFDKGTSRKLPYGNLSGGETAAFDLLFDIFLKKEEYDDTVFCIDEPEAHMNPRLQGNLLDELFCLMNDKSQLWIATHAIGIMRKALELYDECKDQVVFLDFTDRDFDDEVVIEPQKPTRKFWEKTHEIALDDLAALVAPERIIICEGSHGNGFDADCYNQIFSEEFPDTKFVSAGGKRDLQNYISVVEAITKGANVLGLRDRDHETSAGDVARSENLGIKVLNKGKIENYLLADEVLDALCQDKGLEPCNERADELKELRDSAADIKSAPNQIRIKVVEWNAREVGEKPQGFMRETLAPLIKPGMSIYNELKEDIFHSGENT